MTQRLLNQFARLDLGFIGSRFLLMLPLIAIERQAGDAVTAAQGLREYQACIFLSTIAIFGAFEHYVIAKRFLPNSIRYLASRFTVIGIVGVILHALHWTHFSASIWLFIATVRGGSSARLVQLRSMPWKYLRIVLSTVASVSILFIDIRWWLVAAIPSALAILSTASDVAEVHGQDHPVELTREFKSGTPYFLSQFLSASFFQGSLFVYLMLSEGQASLVASRVYFFAFAAAAPVSLAGRAVLMHTSELDSQSRSGFLKKGLWITTGLGSIAAISVWVFSERLEAFLYGESLIGGASLVFLSMLIVSHNVSAFLASYIISIGKIRGQLISSAAGILTVAIMFLLLHSYGNTTYACALFCGSIVALLLRFTCAIEYLYARQPSLEITQ
ncbi:polysaccharide biosynthesis protein [Allorhodopirellula solitaria]|uniref:Uncharacterized protein n=1 Tax=Allorhodopirellula solitaria TaxID=2527987 RepID=A0A5C5WQR3_9BACT|nr:hypothetical protein [Allorhodopirellula solitaria]TWT52132.1 hypothetical protein CA85_51000 [Allorhodopirellula solitaria]